MLIERLSDIERIYALEADFKKETGIEPFNISSWIVSENFKAKFLQCFRSPEVGNAVDYVYTYSFTGELQNLALNKLGVDGVQNAMLLILPNNTIAIVNAVNLIKLCGCQKICIVNPSYFSVLQTLQSMGLSVHTASMIRYEGKYALPLDHILSNDYDAVWITSPVFSTGVYLDADEICKIKTMLNNGLFIVADESFALHGHELVREVGVHRNFLSICSPHKSISCNGIKFSSIITSEEHTDTLEQWVAVLCGNLPLSTQIAFYHFLSNNYDECQKLFLDEMEAAKQAIQPMLEGNHHTTDWTATGSLLSVYFDNVPFEYTRTNEFFQNLMKNTYSSILPGWLNGFGLESNLCFRINLALDGISLRQSLFRIIKYLETF